jgi:Rieske Fe-S protein
MNPSRRKFIQHAAWGAVAMALPALASCTDSPTSEPTTNTIPNPPTDLRVSETLRYVMLIWNAPTTNTDGTPLNDLQAYQIFRKVMPDGEFQFVQEIQGSGTIFIDASTGENKVVYQVIAKTRRGAVSARSESSPSARAQLKIRSSDVPPIGTRSLFDAQGNRVTEPTSATVSVERLSENGFLALELTCTHAGCGGMNLIDGNWVCRCHGSRFDSQGNVVQPPAVLPLLRLRTSFAVNGELILRVI